MSSKVFIELEPKLKSALANKANIKTLEQHIKSYIGQNAAILSQPSLNECPSFSKGEDQAAIFNCIGVSREELKDVLSRTSASDVKRGWRMFSNEMYLACTMAVRGLLKQNLKQTAELVQLYFAIWIYSNMHRKYWEFGNKLEVMEYTIQQLSLKFSIKQTGSLLATLRKSAESNLANCKSKLLSTDDDSIFVYARDMRSRINSMVKNIAEEYYRHYENGDYLNIDKSSAEDEDGEQYSLERSTDSGNIMAAAESYVIWFMTNKLNDRLLRTISSLTPGISPAKLANTLNSLKADQKNRLKRIVIGMLGALSESTSDNKFRAIHSKEFPLYCVKLLSLGNTKNELITGMKASLESLLMDYNDTFRSTRREATKIQIRKAAVLYIAMSLQLQRK